MEYWLFKSEPGTWSWEDQVKKGKEGEGWDGVRNYQANNNMKKFCRVQNLLICKIEKSFGFIFLNIVH